MGESGVIRTVDGDLQADQLGVILPHEHVICDSSVWLDADSARAHPGFADTEPELGNLWWMRQFPNSNRSVLRLDDWHLAGRELTAFGRLGGSAVVDLTSDGLGRNVTALRSIARASGVRIVSGTGFYIGPSHPGWVQRASLDELAAFMAREISEGVADTGIRCGVIGEIGRASCRERVFSSV